MRRAKWSASIPRSRARSTETLAWVSPSRSTRSSNSCRRSKAGRTYESPPSSQLGQTGGRKRGSPGRPRNEEQQDDDSVKEGSDARAQGREAGRVEHKAGGQCPDCAGSGTQQVSKTQRRRSFGRGRDVTDHGRPAEIRCRPAESHQEESERAQRRLRQSNREPADRDQRRAREQALSPSNAIQKDAPDR